jgi:diguanylate cyclase (GGDEF)-like protein
LTHKTLANAVRVCTVWLVLSLCAGAALFLKRDFTAARTTAENHLQQNARVGAAIINRQLLQIDSTLANLHALITVSHDRHDASDPYRQILQALNSQPFTFRDLLVIKRDGTVLGTARAGARRDLGWAAQGLGNVPSSRGTVLGPFRSQATSEWSLYLARTLVPADPSDRLVLAELPVSMVMSPLSVLAETPGTLIKLTRGDGSILGSLPHREELFNASAPFGPPHGEAVLVASEPTLYGDLELTLTVPLQNATAAWRTERDRVVVIVLAVSALLIVVAGVVLRGLRHQERSDRARQQAQETLEEAVAAMADGFVLWDRHDRFLMCNERYREIYARTSNLLKPGAAFEDVIRAGAANGQYPQAGPDIDDFVRQVVTWHRRGEGEMERLLPDGRWLLVRERRMANGGVVGIRTDITQIKTLVDQLAMANARVEETMAELQVQNNKLIMRDRELVRRNHLFNEALQNMSHGLLMVNEQGQIIVYNRRLLQLLDPPDQGDGARIFTVADLDLFAGQHESAAGPFSMLAPLSDRALASGATVKSVVGRKTLSLSARPMESGGYVTVVEDVSEQQAAEQRISFLAHHDPLTKLPNRARFAAKLEQALSGRTDRQACICVLYLDLDRFKQVNDTIGHFAGDQLLIEAADRLQAIIGHEGTVCRLGGDEFAIIIPDDPIHLPARAQRIIGELSRPYWVCQREVVVGISVGSSNSQRDGCTPDSLLRKADIALNAAKSHGKGCYRDFAPEMQDQLDTRVLMEGHLRHAIAERQFSIAYQPIISSMHNRPCAVEALLRWTHPEIGPVSPAEFIPLAESIGLIDELGQWVLEQACQAGAPLPSHMRIAVNLSPLQLKNPSLAHIVQSALALSDLDPARLELEITETALLDADARIVTNLHTIREMGVSIVLDDFGTGYSSLSHISRYPFQKIKIDRSFIAQASRSAECRAIIRAVTTIASELGMRTTAEGIETLDQLNLIRSFGCDESQGYLHGRPGSILQVFTALHAIAPARVDLPIAQTSLPHKLTS